MSPGLADQRASNRALVGILVAMAIGAMLAFLGYTLAGCATCSTEDVGRMRCQDNAIVACTGRVWVPVAQCTDERSPQVCMQDQAGEFATCQAPGVGQRSPVR